MTSNWLLMLSLFTDVLKFSPFNTILTLVLMLFRNISAGASLLLIIPLLQVIGLSVSHGEISGITMIITSLFQKLHLPLNLFSILMSYVVVVSFIAVAAYVEQITSTKLQHQYIHYLRGRLYTHILHATWPFFLQQKISDLLHGLTTQIQTISASNFQLLTLVNNLILLCVYTTIALLLSWQMTLVAIFCAFLLLSMMLPLHRLTSQAGHHHLKQNQAIMQSITEQLGALKMIKGSGFEDLFVKETRRISSSLEHQNQHFTHVTAMTKLLYTMGSVITFSALLYFALTVFSMPVESLLLLLVVFSRLLPKVSTVQQNYQRILHQLPSYSEVKKLMEECKVHQEDSLSDHPGSLNFKKAITLREVGFSYAYSNSPPIIRSLSLQLPKNTTTAIVGPSGAGKSTLADLIVGLLTPSSGKIYIDDQALEGKHQLVWRQSVAYVTQDTFLFNTSIRDNLQLLNKNTSDEALWDALQLAAAADFVARLEKGLDTVIGDRGVRLSVGERQRIALARALLTNPELLVLDESTSSLDKENIIKIQQALKRLHGKITILIISHQMEMSDFADQRILLGNLSLTKQKIITGTSAAL